MKSVKILKVVHLYHRSNTKMIVMHRTSEIYTAQIVPLRQQLLQDRERNVRGFRLIQGTMKNNDRHHRFQMVQRPPPRHPVCHDRQHRRRFLHHGDRDMEKFLERLRHRSNKSLVPVTLTVFRQAFPRVIPRTSLIGWQRSCDRTVDNHRHHRTVLWAVHIQPLPLP